MWRGLLEELLHVDDRIAERRLRFVARQRHGRQQRRFGVHDAHAAPAAAAGRLDDHRVADRARDLDDLLRIFGQRAFGTGHARHARLRHRVARADLVAHQPDRFGLRADEHEARTLDLLREVGVLGQEAVAGMDRLRVRHFRRGDDRGNVQVALRRRRRADADGFIGERDVLGVAVGLRMHDDRLDAELAARALDAQRDFAAIGDQDLVEQLVGTRSPPCARACHTMPTR